MLFKKRKVKKMRLNEDTDGMKSYRKIDHFCCLSFDTKRLEFGAPSVEDLDDLVDSLECIEHQIKINNATRQVMDDWKAGKISDRQAIVYIIENLKPED